MNNSSFTSFCYFCARMKRLILFFIVFAFIAIGCSKYQKVLKGTNPDEKFELALKLYNKKNYYKALPLFEELTTIYRGQKKAEQVAYYYAYCNFNAGDFETAAYDFDNFTKTFPQSQFAEECAYMNAYCYYKGSPSSSLDQTYTLRAINQLQLFADNYPSSTRMEECNKLVDELRGKLEVKDFENAYLYYKMEDYKASIYAFNNLLKEYPATIYRERGLFYILRSSWLLAENSIESKKGERFLAAMTAFDNFIAAYPESEMAAEARNIFETCKQKSDTFASQNK